MQNNYFLAVLGELLQRMDNERTNYSIALPNLQKFRRLWNQLPLVAKTRTGITVLFVDEKGKVTHFTGC